MCCTALDEPSIGLHQRDNDRLIETLCRLRDQGNTVIVVEHDEDTIRAADYVIDMGPGAGELGGKVVCAGTPAQIMACSDSLTGQYLTGQRMVRLPERRRNPYTSGAIKVVGARANNLKNVTVKVELGTFTVVTGVSGSGKKLAGNRYYCSSASPTLFIVLKRLVGPMRRLEGLELAEGERVYR